MGGKYVLKRRNRSSILQPTYLGDALLKVHTLNVGLPVKTRSFM